MSDHKITVEGPLAYPGGKDGMFWSSCSCGKYRSGFYVFPGHAERAGEQHAKAKGTS